MVQMTCLLLAVAYFASGILADTVPVLMWGPLSKSGPALNDRSQAKFIETVTSSTFTLAFFERRLNAEDITLCKAGTEGSCFPYLSSVSPKSYYTQVSQPLERLEDSVESIYYAYVDKDGSLGQEIPLKPSVVIVYLEEDPELDRDENFVKHDSYIKQIYNNVTSKLGADKVLALYTGEVSNSLVRRVRQATNETAQPAAVPATSSQPESTFSSPTFLVYYTGLTFTSNKVTNTVDITGMTISKPTEISFDVTMTTKADSLTFTVNNIAGYWSLSNIQYGNVLLKTAETVGAINGFSYYCGPKTTYSANNGQQILTWVGLQMEPNFSNTTTASSPNMARFNDPYNCVGFTSIPIWSGLFVSFMMLGILSAGIVWMMDINTMDRFDDPKGKTIIINTTD